MLQLEIKYKRCEVYVPLPFYGDNLLILLIPIFFNILVNLNKIKMPGTLSCVVQKF